MPWNYIVSRLAMFFVTIFIASTIVYFCPGFQVRTPLKKNCLKRRPAVVSWKIPKRWLPRSTKNMDLTNLYGNNM